MCFAICQLNGHAKLFSHFQLKHWSMPCLTRDFILLYGGQRGGMPTFNYGLTMAENNNNNMVAGASLKNITLSFHTQVFESQVACSLVL